MRFVSFVTLFILIVHYADCQEILRSPIQIGNPYYKLVEKSIKQPIDHFDKNEKRSFDFLYYAKHGNDYSKQNAPIYLWLTGDFDLGLDYFAKDLSMVDKLVKETNGSVYITFSRYLIYPNLDKVLPHDKDYFKFLTTEQVLADYANLIKSIKAQPGHESSKVVLVGTNEGGQEATWMRMKYPELVDAVVAANAALLAKKEFNEYFNVINNAYEKYGTPDCLDKITKHYHSIDEMMNSTDGRKRLIEEYQICKDVDFTVDLDRHQFWYHGAYAFDCILLTLQTSSDLKTACENKPAFKFPIYKCVDFHVDHWKDSLYLFPYIYQQCSEFGRFHVTSAKTTPFVHAPLEYHLQICNLFFGIDEKRLDEGIAKTNKKFGGITPNVTNVVFTYGELDANRFLGVTKNLSDTVVSYVIDGVGSLNVPYISPNDPKELVETRNAVISLIKKWISA